MHRVPTRDHPREPATPNTNNNTDIISSNHKNTPAAPGSLEAELGNLEAMLNDWTEQERDENAKKCQELFDELVGEEKKYVNILKYIVEVRRGELVGYHTLYLVDLELIDWVISWLIGWIN